MPLHDGVTEAESATGEQFGEARPAETLQAHAGRDPARLLDAVLARLADWRGGREPGDDVTLVALQVLS